MGYPVPPPIIPPPPSEWSCPIIGGGEQSSISITISGVVWVPPSPNPFTFNGTYNLPGIGNCRWGKNFPLGGLDSMDVLVSVSDVYTLVYVFFPLNNFTYYKNDQWKLAFSGNNEATLPWAGGNHSFSAITGDNQGSYSTLADNIGLNLNQKVFAEPMGVSVDGKNKNTRFASLFDGTNIYIKEREV